MASKLQILIETLYKGKGAQQAKKDMKGLDDATTKGAKSQTSMKDALGKVALAAGVVGGALFAAKKAFDFGAEGAQILRTRDVFDRLTESIGTTADMVLGKMRDATMGMVADSELMRASARTMSMGLASTGDEVAKLAEIAVVLGAAMGKEAGPAMEEFGLLLANTSTLRLDTFGISAGKVKARIIELRDATPGLSREMAFMTATMEQAEISMDKLGDSVRADSFSVAAAEAANLTDELKVLVSEGLAPLVSGIAGVLKASRELRDISKESAEAQAGLREHFDLSATAMMKLERAILNEIAGEKLAVHSTEQHAAAKVILAKMLDLSAANANLTWKQLEKLAKQELKTGATTESLTKAYAAMAKAEGRVIGATEEATTATEKWAKALGIKLATDADKAEQELRDLVDEAAVADRTFFLAAESAEYLANKIEEQQETLEDLRDEYVFSDKEIRRFFDMMEGGWITVADLPEGAREGVEEFRQAVEDAKNEILGLSSSSEAEKAAIVGLWVDAQREAEEYRAWIAGVNADVEGMAEFYDPALAKLREMNEMLSDLDGKNIEYTVSPMFIPPSLWPGVIGAPGGPIVPGLGGTGHVVEEGPATQPLPLPPPDRPGGPQAQHGLDMRVPPGFNNDSFPIWTSSGERVTVQTPAQQKAGGTGGGIVVNVYTGSGNPDLIGSKVAGRVAEVLGARG